jgi:hypothetical protein
MLALTVGLAGCAASPIAETDGGDPLEVDSGLMATEEPASQDDDKDEPGVDPNADLNSGSTPPAVVSPRPDAGSDAGSATLDAGAKDAGSKTTPAVPAVPDAAIVDAGRGASTPVDSGATVPVPTPAKDAGASTPKPGSCRSASDCKESCVPIGILNCCRDNGTCGCTWAPGAYCS